MSCCTAVEDDAAFGLRKPAEESQKESCGGCDKAMEALPVTARRRIAVFAIMNT
jgi:hypothetical protein